MFTDQEKAIDNKRALEKEIRSPYKGENIKVDYLLNPSHIAGLGDVFAVSYQKFFENENISDYDLVEMWDDASQKVKTKKLLLVAHSQGNFYANSLFTEISGLNIGERKKIPLQSVGIYGVATPASYIASADGKYITSKTDTVINKVRTAGVLDVLPANVDIKLPIGDNSNGHSFSEVYLKYEGGKVISEIKNSLDRLSSTVIQDENKPCIAPPEPSILHETAGLAFAVTDPVAVATKKATVAVATASYRAGRAIANAYLNLIENTGELLANVLGAVEDSAPQISLVINHTADASDKKEASPLQSAEAFAIPPQTESTITGTITEALPPPANTSEPVPVPIIPPASINSSAYGSWGGGGPAAANLLVASTPDPAPVASDPVSDPIPDPVVPEPTPDPEPEAPAPDPVIPDPDPVTPEPDITPPVITIVGNNPFNTFVGANYNDQGATAEDGVDGVRSVVTDGSVDTSTVGAYEIGYTAEDLSGNSVRQVRTVSVSQLNTNFPVPSNTISTTLISNTDWTLANSPYVVTGELQINPGVTLNIEPGVVVKFADVNSYILVNNSILRAQGTATDKIYFTSIKDDTIGGDANADGSVSLPTAGDWRGIYITGNNPDYSSSLSNVILRYAGASSYPALYDRDQAISITDSLITNNGTIGFYKIHNNVNVTISRTEISGHAFGLYLETGILNISNSNIKNNLAYGAYAGQFAAFNGQNNFWGDATGPYNSTLNESGLGNAITNNISFDPWLTTAPF